MNRNAQFFLLGALLIAGTAATAFLGLSIVQGQDAQPMARVDKLDHKGYAESFQGSWMDKEGKRVQKEVKFEMVAVPGGVYQMGSPASEAGRNADEGPQHWVQVGPLWMGKCEVTWDELDVYRNEKGVDDPEINDAALKKMPDAITGPTPPYVDETYGHGREGHPALCMTHHLAMEYCRWLTLKTGKLYRLPTEAEWEWACRAGTQGPWFFGSDAKDFGAYGWYKDNAAANADESPITHEVGTRKPNPWGLHDMYGNVMEWCLDHYKKDAYSAFPANALTLAPVMVPTDKRFSHVARGGSWADDPLHCRSASRRGSDKKWIQDDPQRPQSIWWLTKFDVIGFRVVRAVQEQETLKTLRSKVTRESD